MKTLIWDIETAGVNSFKADLAVVVCIGYKWFGESEAHVIKVDDFPGWFKPNRTWPIDDKPLLKKFIGMLESERCGKLIHHYGSWFDWRFVLPRCAMHRIPLSKRLRKVIRYDTVAKTRQWAMMSRRLAHEGDFLGVGEKKQAKTYPQAWPGWWHRTLAGDAVALHKMARYCKQDVEALAANYEVIKSYVR